MRAKTLVKSTPVEQKKISHKFLSPLRHLLKSHDARKKLFKKSERFHFQRRVQNVSVAQYHQHVYAMRLCAKIPKMQKASQVINVFLHFYFFSQKKLGGNLQNFLTQIFNIFL